MVNIKETDKIHVEIHMPQYEYNKQKIKEVKKEFAKKYNVSEKQIEIEFKPVSIDENGEKISLIAEVKNNIQNPSYQKELMQKYINLKEYKDIKWEDIDIIDNQINSYIEFDQYSKYKNYKFKYVKWSNYLSYGEDNYFDFTKLNGLVLLNSDPSNQGGKTTFAIDLLRFALFGKADKSPNLASVFNMYNDEATQVIVEVCIEIDNEDYIIRRTVSRPELKKRTSKSKCKQKVEYYKQVLGDLIEIDNCEGENSQQTNNIIKESVGSVEDFDLVISATSHSLCKLLDIGESERGRLFSKWLGLLSIEEKEKIAKEIWKNNYEKNLLRYNREDVENEINNLNEFNNSYNEAIISLENDYNKTETEINTLTKDKEQLYQQLKTVENGLDKYDINTLERQISDWEAELTIKRELYKSNSAKIQNLNNDIDENLNLDEQIELKSKEKEINSYINQLTGDNGEIRGKINSLKEKLKEVDELKEKGVCPTCHHTISDLEYNDLKQPIIDEINDLTNKGVQNKNIIDNYKKEIENIQNKLTYINNQSILITQKAKLDIDQAKLKVEGNELNKKIDENKKIKDNIKNNELIIKHNNDILLKINIIDTNIKNSNDIKILKIKDIERYKNEISNNNIKIEEKNKILQKLNEEIILCRNWNVYKELVGKDGIIKLVLKESLPIINNEIARSLNGLCDFETVLDVNEKNDVVINLVRDGVIMDLTVAASGFEGTIASLALRSALASISSISKPNFIVLDEVTATVSSDNLENIHELYKRIVGNYDFIINITHNENIHDWHNHVITVTKTDNISKIEKFN